MTAIDVGAPHAEKGAIVTFGAEPTEANTQYGYIEADTSSASPDGAFPIARFVEKPNAETAAEYLATGRFFWNAGIFLVKASTLLDEMRQLLPASLDTIARSVAGATTDGLFVRPAADAFNRAENISIDHGIMEKDLARRCRAGSNAMVGRRLLGCGVEARRSTTRTAMSCQGDVAVVDTRNSLLRSDHGPFVAAIGLDKWP